MFVCNCFSVKAPAVRKYLSFFHSSGNFRLFLSTCSDDSMGWQVFLILQTFLLKRLQTHCKKRKDAVYSYVENNWCGLSLLVIWYVREPGFEQRDCEIIVFSGFYSYTRREINGGIVGFFTQPFTKWLNRYKTRTIYTFKTLFCLCGFTRLRKKWIWCLW